MFGVPVRGLQQTCLSSSPLQFTSQSSSKWSSVVRFSISPPTRPPTAPPAVIKSGITSNYPSYDTQVLTQFYSNDTPFPFSNSLSTGPSGQLYWCELSKSSPHPSMHSIISLLITYNAPNSFNLPINPSTSSTLPPPCLGAGSVFTRQQIASQTQIKST